MAQSVLFRSTSLILVTCMLTGCLQKISLSGKSDTELVKRPIAVGKRRLLTEPAPGAQGTQPGSPPPSGKPSPAPDKSAAKDPVILTGQWKVGFLYGTKNLTSTIALTQEGNNFHGEGTDDDTNLPFSIEAGTIDGQHIAFVKKYSDGKHLPIEYGGTFQNVKDPNYVGPYLNGEYQLNDHGKPVAGVWEAEIASGQSTPANSQAPQEGPPAETPDSAPSQPVEPQSAPTPDHAPHLSGKWNAGFEYNFKIIHSTMYLEQDGGKLTGHGIDENTKEKFVIAKGWYNYPRVMLVRKYIKGKNAAGNRELAFKGTVSWVSAPDYQGPYLSGKTQGGGAWEAQVYK